MARFPVNESKLADIGKALARAVTDPVAKADLSRDPSNYLISAGVDPAAIEGLSFNVVEDTATNLNLVIPASLDDAKVEASDTEYLKALGNTVVLACAL